MMVINNEYAHGDIVYLKTDREQLPRIVFCMKVYLNEVLYEVACGTVLSAHYDFELTKEKDVINAI